jgi:hypothetical protein
MSFRYLLSLEVRLSTATRTLAHALWRSIWDDGTERRSREGHPFGRVSGPGNDDGAEVDDLGTAAW